MKKSFLIICAGFLFLAGCKEVGPGIDLGNITSTQSADTAYILPAGSIPAAQPHNVLVEDFTGQSCPNCPAADVNLASEASTYPGQINIISLFSDNALGGPPQDNPPANAKYDLEDTLAYDIGEYTYLGLGQLPTVGVDRVPAAGGNGISLEASGIWDAAIQSQTKVNDSVILTVQSSYTGSVATTTVTVTYAQTLNYTQSINVALVEDSIYDVHEGYTGAYLYMNVFRGMVTPGITGVLINYRGSANEPAGLYWRQVYSYSLPAVITNTISDNAAIVPNHCRVVAYLVNSSNGCIAQSAQAPLMGQ